MLDINIPERNFYNRHVIVSLVDTNESKTRHI